jgi:hypothetical protein
MGDGGKLPSRTTFATVFEATKNHSSKKDRMTLAVSRIQQLKRRSSRMALDAKVGISGEDRQKCSFTMPARATGLNRHGAAVQLNRELQIGTTVVIQNSRHTKASARVVTQVSAVGGVFTYGVEFQEDDSVKNFWGITFPAQS